MATPNASLPNQTSNAPAPSSSLSPPPSPSVSQPPSNPRAPPPSVFSSPSNSSAPAPQNPSPATPAAPSPSPPPSPPPPPPLSSSPPSAPPPSTPASPPPASPVTPPPASLTTPPPIAKSPPHPILSPPPSFIESPPPQAPVSSSPPQAPPPASPPPASVSSPPPALSFSPPPPGKVPSPPSMSPPPPVTKPIQGAPAPSASPPPPITSSQPPPSVGTPPPAVPSSLPPSVSPPAPQGNTSADAPSTSSSIPTIPTEKPTARSTTSSPPGTKTTGGGNLKAGPAAAIGIVVGFLVLSLAIFAVWLLKKRKKKKITSNNGFTMPSPSSQSSDSYFLKPQHSPHNSAQYAGSNAGSNFGYSSEGGGIANSRSWFTYDELAAATNQFSSNNLLGEGGFGCVYKGILADGREVAVKQLKAGGGQGEREFRAEVEIISRIHHRHLVSLVGYCIYEYQRILVYDFVSNDTLNYHLHGESRVMDWATRVKVAAGAARGIAYLHEGCNPRIIHRDIKSPNILLDENFEAKVADFGLAKLAMELDSQTHVSTRVMGTFGYMAPEYATSGKLTEKSDVYSFGVVLLEIITGRKPVDASQPFGDEGLVEWARPMLTQALDDGIFEDLVDPRLENFVESEMFRMVETAAACVRHSASKRPRMSQVVRALDMLDEGGDITNGMRPGQSQIYDSRQQSAQIRMFQRMAFGSQGFSTDSFSNSQSSWMSQTN